MSLILVHHNWRNLFITWIKSQNNTGSFHIFLAKLLWDTYQVIIVLIGKLEIVIFIFLKYSTSKIFRFQKNCMIHKKKCLKYLKTL